MRRFRFPFIERQSQHSTQHTDSSYGRQSIPKALTTVLRTHYGVLAKCKLKGHTKPSRAGTSRHTEYERDVQTHRKNSGHQRVCQQGKTGRRAHPSSNGPPEPSRYNLDFVALHALLVSHPVLHSVVARRKEHASARPQQWVTIHVSRPSLHCGWWSFRWMSHPAALHHDFAVFAAAVYAFSSEQTQR